MKRMILLAILNALLWQNCFCQSKLSKATLRITIPGVEGKAFLKLKVGNEFILKDSSDVQEGKSVLIAFIDEPKGALLQVNDEIKSFVIYPGLNIIKGRKDSIARATVINYINPQFEEYQRTIASPAKRELMKLSQLRRQNPDSLTLDSLNKRTSVIGDQVSAATRVFIRTHPRSFYSLMLLESYMNGWEPDSIASLFAALRLKEVGYPTVKKIKGYLAQFNTNKKMMFNLPDGPWSINKPPLRNPQFFVVDFWGTWCSPCVSALPELVEQYTLLKQRGIEFIGIACERNKDSLKVKELLTKYKIEWPQLIQDLNGSNPADLKNKYQVASFPTYYLLDQRYKILSRQSGTDGFERVKQKLMQLQKEHPL